MRTYDYEGTTSTGKQYKVQISELAAPHWYDSDLDDDEKSEVLYVIDERLTLEEANDILHAMTNGDLFLVERDGLWAYADCNHSPTDPEFSRPETFTRESLEAEAGKWIASVM